jgi:hypothetical protein
MGWLKSLTLLRCMSSLVPAQLVHAGEIETLACVSLVGEMETSVVEVSSRERVW